MKVTINGKEIELELTAEQKAVVERALRPQTGWERVGKSEAYGYADSEGVFFNLDCLDDKTDIKYDRANYFSNRELVRNIDRAQTLQRRLWRRSAELCKKIEWNDFKPNFAITYNHAYNRLHSASMYDIDCLGTVFFDTEEHAEQVLEEFRDELTWYFTEFKARMD